MASPAKRQRTDNGGTSLFSPSSKSGSPRGRGRGRGRASSGSGRARGGARGGRSSASSSTRTTPNSSPSKKRGSAASAAASSKPIYTFFNTSVLQSKLQDGRPGDDIDKAIEDDFVDDVIDDDSPDEDYFKKAKTENGVKKEIDGLKDCPVNGHSPAKKVHASRSFVSVPKPLELAGEDDSRPWADRFPPRALDELAVHKKKVADVKAWFEGVYSGQDRKRLLVLKGPAGSGKTATVDLLAHELGVDVLEWRNPSGAEVSTDGYFSASAQFEEFLFRGRKYSTLEFDHDPAPTHHEDSNRRKMIVVEEFPNTFNRASSVLKSFQNTLKLFLASNTPRLQHMFSQHQQDPIIPLVLIISETALTTTSAAADSFTAHRLLGQDILNHAGTTLINFNPVAPTLLAKALELLVQKEAQVSGRKNTPSRAIWEKLGEVGDIRSAISSLEFMMLRGDDGANWSGRVKPANSKKRIRDDGPLTQIEKESIEMITQRESSLGMFHAIGKIVWNKRHPAETENVPPVIKPPKHLRHHDRELCSMVAVNDLIDEIGTSTQIFISALHENCLLSCNHPQSSADSIEYFNGCIDALSDSDLLAPNWDGGFGSGGMGGGFGRGAFQGAAQDSLRQDEVSFQVACRGILFSLPLSVKRIPPPVVAKGKDSRWNRPSGGRGDAFKMFYPMGLRLWRVQEEIEGLIDHWISKILKGLHLPPAKAQKKAPGITPMQAWRSPNKATPAQQTSKPLTATAPEFIPSSKGSANAGPQSVPIIPRLEALLERLPYLYHLHSASHSPLIPPSKNLKDLEKMSQLRGVNMNAMSDEVPSDEEELEQSTTAADSSWTTDRPLESGATPKKKGADRWKLFGKGLKKEESVEEAATAESKGWLSDDDIVDDD